MTKIKPYSRGGFAELSDAIIGGAGTEPKKKALTVGFESTRALLHALLEYRTAIPQALPGAGLEYHRQLLTVERYVKALENELRALQVFH